MSCALRLALCVAGLLVFLSGADAKLSPRREPPLPRPELAWALTPHEVHLEANDDTEYVLDGRSVTGEEFNREEREVTELKHDGRRVLRLEGKTIPKKVR